MAEYIEREALLAFLEENHTDRDWLVNQYNADWICSWIESQPAADVVSRGVYEQVRWERDVAIEQLRTDYGVGFGEKKSADVVEVPCRCKDCKHWMDFPNCGCTDFAKVCALAEYMIGANGYCLYGEKKDGE